MRSSAGQSLLELALCVPIVMMLALCTVGLVEIADARSGLDAASLEKLQRFGAVHEDGDWVSVDGVLLDVIPDLVAEIVALGGRVYAVEPRHHSLEDRFMELLGGEP